MRHRVFGKVLGRNFNQRKALLNGLVRSFFTYGHVKTTEAKAKSVLSLVEHLCHVAQKNTLTSRRDLYRYLQNHAWVNSVCETLSKEYPNQTSNFTKISKLYFRQGDNALIVRLFLTKDLKFKTTTIKAEVIKPEVKKVEDKKPKVTVKSVKKTKAKKA